MERKLKLNYKKTFFVGLAFFAILMLWQVYNTYCPLILREFLESKFDNADKLTYVIGIIMAMDNLAALIFMPIFGNLSDKTHTKYGKRMPYILVGMILSAMIFPFIVVFYLMNSLVGVILLMGLVLTIMQCYRSPAVALMPDFTPKPLRSSANGIINLVGYVGAILGGALAIIFKKGEGEQFSMAYLWPFIITSICMLVAMIILSFAINEPKLIEASKDDVAYGETLSQSLEDVSYENELNKKDFSNLIILLIAVFFWFMAFNAVETFNSLFCEKILENTSIHGTFTIILTVSSLISFILFSSVSNKIGRKWSIVIGLILLIAGFSAIAIGCFTIDVKYISIVFYICTVIIGVGWAFVNINSYPMIVEMSNKNNVGKFTGYYYTASMVAQTTTPILVGLIMSFNDKGLRLLYIYSAIMMIVACIFILFAKERRDIKKQTVKKKFLEKLADPED